MLACTLTAGMQMSLCMHDLPFTRWHADTTLPVIGTLRCCCAVARATQFSRCSGSAFGGAVGNGGC